MSGAISEPDVPGPVAGDVLDTAEAGRRVVRGGALRVVGFVAGLGASLIGAALVTRHLGPVDYGRYQTVVALVTIVQAVTDLGMSTLGLREYAQRTGADRARFMRVLLGMRLALTALGGGAAMLASVALGYDSQMVFGAGFMSIGLLFMVTAGTLGIPLSAEIRMGAVTGLDVGRQVATAALFVVLVVVGAGVPAFLAATIPVHLLLAVATYVLVRGAVPLRPSFDWHEWLALVRPTITFALATAVGSLYVYTALVLTSLVASQEQTGLFAASFRVYIIAAAIPGVLVTTAFPLLSRAARDDRERLRYATQRLFEGTAVLGGGALIACVLGAVPIIAVVAGPKYAGAVDVLRIQGTALAMTFVISTWGFTLLAMHRHRAMVRANAVALVISAVTVLLLAHAHGAVGAAFGTLLGETWLACGYLWGIVGGDPRMRPRTRRVRRLLPAVALGLAAWFLPLPDAANTIVGLLVYAAGLLVFGALPEEVREHLPGPLRRLGPRDIGGDD
ncbi:oligosaccharide flippase family protein [Baekduia soli]|uniref:oligosaccharide flippase family protein n=1 Tax=Baekduia soli TaxID=496014 RepID=UPI00165288C1|nr:oligosaccharide flippase family protein [Baekduia soli]